MDGQQLPKAANDSDWKTTSTYHLPAGYQLLAVEAFDSGAPAGILASLDDGTVTDSSWKCSSVHEANWESVEFTESSNFKNATEIGQHGMEPWGTMPRIAANATWIWTAANDTLIYCRKTIGEQS